MRWKNSLSVQLLLLQRLSEFLYPGSRIDSSGGDSAHLSRVRVSDLLS